MTCIWSGEGCTSSSGRSVVFLRNFRGILGAVVWGVFGGVWALGEAIYKRDHPRRLARGSRPWRRRCQPAPRPSSCTTPAVAPSRCQVGREERKESSAAAAGALRGGSGRRPQHTHTHTHFHSMPLSVLAAAEAAGAAAGELRGRRRGRGRRQGRRTRRRPKTRRPSATRAAFIVSKLPVFAADEEENGK